MGRPRKRPESSPGEEHGNQDEPRRGEPAADAKKLSKSDAVRAALTEGVKSPGDAVAFIQKRFGIEMSRQHFSATKAQIKRREQEGAPTGSIRRGRTPEAAVEGYLAPPKVTPTGEGDLIDVLEKMKPLIAQYGAEKVKRLVDLLG